MWPKLEKVQGFCFCFVIKYELYHYDHENSEVGILILWSQTAKIGSNISKKKKKCQQHKQQPQTKQGYSSCLWDGVERMTKASLWDKWIIWRRQKDNQQINKDSGCREIRKYLSQCNSRPFPRSLSSTTSLTSWLPLLHRYHTWAPWALLQHDKLRRKPQGGKQINI